MGKALALTVIEPLPTLVFAFKIGCDLFCDLSSSFGRLALGLKKSQDCHCSVLKGHGKVCLDHSRSERGQNIDVYHPP